MKRLSSSTKEESCDSQPKSLSGLVIYADPNSEDPCFGDPSCHSERTIPRRRVAFEVDERNQIRRFEAEAATPSNRFCTREDHRDLWWSRLEIQRIQEREQLVCDFHRISEDDYADQVRHIFARSAKGENNWRDAQLLAARSSNRGLENRVVHMMQLHRQKVRQGVLDQQQKVAHLANPVVRQQMIRCRSNFLSKPARAFALAVAQADAVTAQAALVANTKDRITLEQLSFRRVVSTDSRKWGDSFRLQNRWGESSRLNTRESCPNFVWDVQPKAAPHVQSPATVRKQMKRISAINFFSKPNRRLSEASTISSLTNASPVRVEISTTKAPLQLDVKSTKTALPQVKEEDQKVDRIASFKRALSSGSLKWGDSFRLNNKRGPNARPKSRCSGSYPARPQSRSSGSYPTGRNSVLSCPAIAA